MKNTKIDLGYGNPGFIQELWQDKIYFDMTPEFMPYFQAKKPYGLLVDKLKILHQKNKNVIINSNTHIVITVGAVQALQAALSYYHSKGFKEVYIPHPYWGRFDDFTNLHNLKILKEPSNSSISLITSPNNPDGKDQSLIKANIRDACYNWKHYSDNVYESQDEVTVFSLSKLSGYSATRIGWAVVQNKEMAEYMQNYVNIFTSGVSIESQLSANKIVDYILKNDRLLEKSKELLNKRKREFSNLTKNLDIKILSTDGMFLYIECNNSLIEKLNIEAVESGFFRDQNSNCFRLNIGTEERIYQEFISRLKLL